MRHALEFLLIGAVMLATGHADMASPKAARSSPQQQKTVPKPTPSQTEDPIAGVRKEIKDVLAQIGSLQDRVKKLESSNIRLKIQVLGLQQRNRSVSLDPATPKQYQRLDSDAGSFLLSLSDAVPYLDGFRVTVHIGNLTSASYVGFKLDSTWGPRYDWEKYTEESYKKWESLKETKEFSFTDTLQPAAWNKVDLILPATGATQLGFIEVSLKTDVVRLTGGY